MEILSKNVSERTKIIGRFSDGRDREKVTEIIYTVKVITNDEIYTVAFDKDPSLLEIEQAIQQGNYSANHDIQDEVLLIKYLLKKNSDAIRDEGREEIRKAIQEVVKEADLPKEVADIVYTKEAEKSV